jgi:hypothetical protein
MNMRNSEKVAPRYIVELMVMTAPTIESAEGIVWKKISPNTTTNST